ncbi:hypothetical protein NK6_5757 [Bradyrhizobium diazoefficiens]|uniref:Uncharacterized protein n=3 Tax=Nitrobacteraceae TaxID=41294 RepID=A0A0E4BRG6_9BRAD|nr:hypothetical protein NK6_5757 [Bradyrhizobium diazoefficiens]
MMFAIQDVEPDAPLLNLLCVNGTTKLPGTGAHDFLKAYNPDINYKRLKNARKRSVLRPFVDEVYEFKGWPKLAKRVFGITLPKIEPSEPVEADGKAQRLGLARGGPPESEEHIRLKEYVCNNPLLVGAPKGCKKGWPEKQLRSLDEIDVWFMSPGKELAVEVKSRRSNDFDLQRGIYQCVKYRTVLEAQNKADRITSKVRACLVSERKLPDDLARLADLLDIDVRVLRPR